jgi:predicted transcriptional regulator
MRDEIKRVHEIMIPLDKYPYIYDWESLRQATHEIEKFQIEIRGRKSLPRMVLVFNRKSELVGVVRRRDILRGLEPAFLVSKRLSVKQSLFDIEMDFNLSEMTYDHLIEGIRENAVRPVSEIMLPVNVTIEHDDHIIKAIYEMVQCGRSMLPVLKQNRVVGVIRSVDLFEEISQFI